QGLSACHQIRFQFLLGLLRVLLLVEGIGSACWVHNDDSPHTQCTNVKIDVDPRVCEDQRVSCVSVGHGVIPIVTRWYHPPRAREPYAIVRRQRTGNVVKRSRCQAGDERWLEAGEGSEILAGSEEGDAVGLVRVKSPDHFVSHINGYHMRIICVRLNSPAVGLTSHQYMPSPGNN